MRKWGGFVVRHDPRRRLIAGVLFDRMFGAPSEAAYFHIRHPLGGRSCSYRKAMGGYVHI